MSFPVDGLPPWVLKRYAEVCGLTLAHAHAKSGDAGTISGYLGKSDAFDQAIGLRPDSATALWGGALAHAEIGNKVIARDYLRRTIALQPSWADMALNVPALASFLQVSSRSADRLPRRTGNTTRFTKRTRRLIQSIEGQSIEVSPFVTRYLEGFADAPEWARLVHDQLISHVRDELLGTLKRAVIAIDESPARRRSVAGPPNPALQPPPQSRRG